MKKFDVKKIITILAASAITLSVTSCAKSDGSAENAPSDSSSAAAAASTELKKIVIGTPGANGVAMESATIAQVEKFFDAELEKAGYSVEYQGFALAGPAVNEAFASGAVDFAVYGDQPAITAAANGIDVKIIASVNNYLEHALLVSGNTKLDSLEDLKGKKIVVGFGTPVQRYIFGLLKRAGLSVNDVELINSPTDGPTLIASGDADIAASSQAAIRAYEAQGIGTYYETPLKQDELSQIFVLAASQKSIDKYPGAAEALVKALDSAYKFAQENPDKAYEDLSQGTYPEAINRLIYTDTSFPEFDPVITDEMLTHLQVSIDFMKEQGIINSDIKTEDVADRSYADKALAK
ncbi:MAG: ABC transporter substrate-binding protein [Oscillospiraceae bacterium]